MNKKSAFFGIALAVIFLIVFNGIVFITTKEFSSSFWISYAFIHLAYCILVISAFSVPKASGTVVFGFPLIYLSWIYFIITFFVGLVFMVFKGASVNLALIPQLIISAIFAFIYISHLAINTSSIGSERELREQVFYIKSIASDIQSLLPSIKNVRLRKKVEGLYDAVNSSQIISSNALAEIETEIKVKVDEFKRVLPKGDTEEVNLLLTDLHSLILRRNNKLRINS